MVLFLISDKQFTSEFRVSHPPLTIYF